MQAAPPRLPFGHDPSSHRNGNASKQLAVDSTRKSVVLMSSPELVFWRDYFIAKGVDMWVVHVDGSRNLVVNGLIWHFRHRAQQRRPTVGTNGPRSSAVATISTELAKSGMCPSSTSI